MNAVKQNNKNFQLKVADFELQVSQTVKCYNPLREVAAKLMWAEAAAGYKVASQHT